jgi:predicted RNA binding protein YcfA (HicA-like mRNA interferase family)
MTGNELIAFLKKKGWRLDRIKGSHHIMVKGSKKHFPCPYVARRTWERVSCAP